MIWGGVSKWWLFQKDIICFISSFESRSMLEISRWTRIWVQHSRVFLAVRITFPEVRNRKGTKSGLVQHWDDTKFAILKLKPIPSSCLLPLAICSPPIMIVGTSITLQLIIEATHKINLHLFQQNNLTPTTFVQARSSISLFPQRHGWLILCCSKYFTFYVLLS